MLIERPIVVQKSNVANRAEAGDNTALNTISTHYGSCAWTPKKGFVAWTKQGEVEMFENGGQRAVELFLTSMSSCLTFFLAEYVKAKNLPVTSLRVSCDGRVVPDPERLGSITTRVTIEGTISREDRVNLLEVCDKQWKVMNSIRQPPVCETLLVTPSGEVIS
ncbi:OsmC family protein [Leptospira interrogans]